MPDSPLPQFLVDYFDRRQAARADRINTFLSGLTPREHALVEQAAVMGYVRGSMAPKGAEIPLNKAILAEVVDACFSFPELYPVFHADLAPHPPASEWIVETRMLDGTWRKYGASRDTEAEGLELLERDVTADRGAHDFRLVRVDTTYTVVAEHNPEATQ
ncbi:MAG: hypothetical protein HOV92_12735 [Streptomyces sp.]|nr:hypothetical protein [Streptomyces sp.]